MSYDPVRCPSKALVMDRDNAHRGYWLAMIPDGHNAEDVLRPEYFGFHAGKIRVGDVIEVQSEDMSWWGELLVRAIPAGLNVIVTRKRFLDHFEVDDLPAGYEIKYLGHTGKHTVFYQGNAIQGDFSTREEAAIKVFQLAGRKEQRALEAAAVDSVAAVTVRRKPGRQPKQAESPAEQVAE